MDLDDANAELAFRYHLEPIMAAKQMNLLRGTLDVLILQSLDHEARHGYGVADWIRNTTDGALEVEDGALYTALHRMLRRGWIEATWGVSENNRRAKYYGLTRAGRKELERASLDWERYAAAVHKVLSTRTQEG